MQLAQPSMSGFGCWTYNNKQHSYNSSSSCNKHSSSSSSRSSRRGSAGCGGGGEPHSRHWPQSRRRQSEAEGAADMQGHSIVMLSAVQMYNKKE